MSDLDGEQGVQLHFDKTDTYVLIYFNKIAVSDNEDTSKQTTTNDEYAEEEAPKPISKLPSFKKKSRDVDDEESARMDEVRREIREMKNNGPRRETGFPEDEDEGPVDPRQGKGYITIHRTHLVTIYTALRDEIDREFAKALKGGKKKRKKQDGEDLESSMDDELSVLRERMKLASEEDSIANGERRAAVAKLKLLGEATTMLTK